MSCTLTRSFFVLPTLMLLTACLPSSPNTAQTVESPLQPQPSTTIAVQPAKPTATIVYSDLSQGTSTTNKIVLDKNCQPSSTLTQQSGGYQVVYQSEFQAAGQPRMLTAAQYQDGAVELCLSQPNFRQANRLAAEKLQDVFIGAIGKDTNQAAVFGVKVHEGNGFRVPISEYRLDLSRPEQPDLVLVGTSRSSDHPSEDAPSASVPPTIAPTNSQTDSQTLTNGEWTVTIGNLNSWSGVNNTGNLTYHGCDSQGKCLNLTGGKASERSGQVSYGWQNGEYFYSVSSPVTAEANSAVTSTLMVRKGDRTILRATGLK